MSNGSDKDHYLGNPRVKRAGVQQHYTQQQMDEYIKCSRSPAYFVANYVKVVHIDHGLMNMKPYPYQKKMFDHFNDNRFNIVLACRQSGKSISACAYLIWYAIFKPDKLVAILANKAATAREMLARITTILENLPFFLQPGVKYLNKGNIEFANGSEIIASSTSSSSIRGLSVSLLFLDEFAFVENDGTFYTSTYPVISSGKTSKVIITSTANGVGNTFHKIWEGAVTGVNEYKPFRVDWWDVPGRDDEWKKQTISNTSQLQFDQEFGNNFHGTSDTLINANALLTLKSRSPIEKHENVRYYKRPEEGHKYVITVDVSKGRGQDYSTATVMDATHAPFEQVCTFRDNNISPLLLPDIVVKLGKLYNDALIIVESNDSGEVVCNAIYYELEYDNFYVESVVKKGGIGVTMTKKVKRIGCSNLKDLVERNKIIINDADSIEELTTFCQRGSSYEAKDGCNDDLAMNLVMFSWFASLPIFEEYSSDDLKDILWKERAEQIQEDLVPVGILGNRGEAKDVLSPEAREHIEQLREWGTF